MNHLLSEYCYYMQSKFCYIFIHCHYSVSGTGPITCVLVLKYFKYTFNSPCYLNTSWFSWITCTWQNLKYLTKFRSTCTLLLYLQMYQAHACSVQHIMMATTKLTSTLPKGSVQQENLVAKWIHEDFGKKFDQ